MSREELRAGCYVTVEALRAPRRALAESDGMLVHQRHLSCRRAGAVGTLLYPVSDRTSGIWFIRHEGFFHEIGAYAADELAPCAAPIPSWARRLVSL